MKVLSFALANDAGSEACERFVDVLGLKSLFSAFMNKVGLCISHSALRLQGRQSMRGSTPPT